MTIDAFIGSWTDRDLNDRIDILPQFRSLVIYGPGFTDEGAQILTRCTRLRELQLVETSITDKGMRDIAKLRSLDWLLIDKALVTDSGLNELSDLPRLEGLHVIATQAEDSGFSVLINMPKLEYLEAVGQNLRSNSISIISHLPSLATLRISSSYADDRDFVNLAFSKSIRSISFDMPLVTQEAVSEVKSRMQGRCELESFRFFRPEDRISFLSAYCMDLYTQREFDLARAAAEDVLKFFPFNPAIHGLRALINFQTGNFYDFRKDLETVRDNASAFGEHEIYNMAMYYLSLESLNTVKIAIEEEKPQDLLLRRLLVTTRANKKEPVVNLIDRMKTVLVHPSPDEVMRINRDPRVTGYGHLRKQWGDDVPWQW